MNIGGYIYIKIKIRITFDRRDFTIYQDIGIGCILILYAFLINFSDVDIIKVFKFAKIADYLNPIIKF